MTFQPPLAPQALASARRRLLLQAPLAMGSLGSLGLLGTLGLSPSAFAQATVEAGKPQRGGSLQISMVGDPPNFDSLSNTTGRVISVVAPCCNGLVRFSEFDPDKVVPDLAESWAVSTDGLSCTFQLRKGLKFHDGKPCTATDVKYTFDTLREPPKGIVSIRANLLDAVSGIETPDATTVRFVLKRKSPSLINNLASGWMVVLPKHLLEKGPMVDQIVGTGPFKLKEYKRGVSMEFVRNPDYHVPDRPWLDTIKVFIVPDDNTAYSYFRTGQLDAWGAPPPIVREREKDLANRAYLLASPTTSSMALFFNTQAKPFDDIRVRQAVHLAISREESLKTLFKGEGVLGGYSMPGPWASPKAEVEKIPGYAPYKDSNIAQAKALLAAAGFPNGFKDTMLVRRIALFESHAIFMKDQLTKVGIDITLDIQETATYNESRRLRKFKLDAGGRSFAINDPDAMYGDSVTCDGAMNVAKLCDAKVDDLFSRQSQELDPAKRLALVRELEARSLAQYSTYMLYFRNQFRFMQKNVHGWALHPNSDNSNRMEDCWKAKA